MSIEPAQPKTRILANERRIAPPPIHPMAALATIALDGVFGVVEIFDPFLLVITSIGVGLIGAITTTFVQHFLAKDTWGSSIAKGMVMGILAGVPYPVTGTAIGVPLLAWAGASQWIKLPSKGNNQIVDQSVNKHLLDKPTKEGES